MIFGISAEALDLIPWNFVGLCFSLFIFNFQGFYCNGPFILKFNDGMIALIFSM